MRHIMQKLASFFHLLFHGNPEGPQLHEELQRARARQDAAERDLRHTMEALTSPRGPQR
jgi:hypothetical protein